MIEEPKHGRKEEKKQQENIHPSPYFRPGHTPVLGHLDHWWSRRIEGYIK